MGSGDESSNSINMANVLESMGYGGDLKVLAQRVRDISNRSGLSPDRILEELREHIGMESEERGADDSAETYPVMSGSCPRSGTEDPEKRRPREVAKDVYANRIMIYANSYALPGELFRFGNKFGNEYYKSQGGCITLSEKNTDDEGPNGLGSFWDFVHEFAAVPLQFKNCSYVANDGREIWKVRPDCWRYFAFVSRNKDMLAVVLWTPSYTKEASCTQIKSGEEPTWIGQDERGRNVSGPFTFAIVFPRNIIEEKDSDVLQNPLFTPDGLDHLRRQIFDKSNWRIPPISDDNLVYLNGSMFKKRR